jgi:hypothetical protein
MTHRLDSFLAAVRRVAAAIALGIALAALVLAAAAPPARAFDDDGPGSDEPGTRLGLSPTNIASGGLLGFLNGDRLTHRRSLAFGYGVSSGPAGRQQGAAAYTDFFSYRLAEKLRFDLALEYNFTSTFRSAEEERGQFSVLPSFALEYHPSQSSLLRFSYERFGPGSPLVGRRFYPYTPY